MIATTTLTSMVRQAGRIHGVRKADLTSGDCLIVETRNSCYKIVCLDNGLFRVSGGWFDRAGVSPATIRINGCTWGGSAIHADLVAGCGLFLEFGNRVITTRICQIAVIRNEPSHSVH